MCHDGDTQEGGNDVDDTTLLTTNVRDGVDADHDNDNIHMYH